MTIRFSRRRFIGNTAALAAGAAASQVFFAPGILAQRSPNSLLNIAGIGVGGRGAAHVKSALSEHLIAVCDTTDTTANAAAKRVAAHSTEAGIKRPLPKVFFDYREMLDKMEKQIDAVFVAVPDHHHAPASMHAIKLGKHVYCEKPLTHDIGEARQMALAAKQHGVATQMGNQGRAEEGWRLLCEMIWAGAIGNVKEVHVWTDRPGTPERFWWPQGGTRPAGADPVPPGLHWNVWLGAAPERPYLNKYKEGEHKGRPVYQPFVWRGWWDFGTGALGDIGCHAISGTFTALKIKYASGVELVKDSGDTTSEMYPRRSIIRWDIAAREAMPPCKIFWYDGGYYPPREVGQLADGQKYPSNGTVIVGDQGSLTFYGTPRLIPESKMQAFKAPPATIPRCASNHFQEWVTACKGGRPAFSNFVDHAGALTEMVLLGNLAIRAGRGKKLEWDGPKMTCTNVPEVNQFVHPKHREGWTL